MSGAVGHWWWQRLSSLVLIPLALWLMYAGIQLSGAGYQAAVAFMSSPANMISATALVAVTAYHAQAGIQVIVEDYIPGKGFPALLIWATRIGCLAGVVAVGYAVFQISAGA